MNEATAAEKLTPERVQAAYDEAVRELEVRERCYPKWVKEGRISRTDASARYQAQQDAVAILATHPAVTVNTTADSTEWKPF